LHNNNHFILSLTEGREGERGGGELFLFVFSMTLTTKRRKDGVKFSPL